MRSLDTNHPEFTVYADIHNRIRHALSTRYPQWLVHALLLPGEFGGPIPHTEIERHIAIKTLT